MDRAKMATRKYKLALPALTLQGQKEDKEERTNVDTVMAGIKGTVWDGTISLVNSRLVDFLTLKIAEG